MIDYKKYTKGQKALPDDKTLADLYAFSRKVRLGGERPEYTSSVRYMLDENGKVITSKNNNSNQYIEGENGYAQLSFVTEGCKIGQCSFCNYGGNSKIKLTPKIVEEEMNKFKEALLAFKANRKEIYSILFDSIGSILDKNEFPPECLDVVFEKLEEIIKEVGTIEDVSFETHYQTLGSYDEKGEFVASDAVQRLIDFKNSHKDIGTFVIELGFETSNSEIRDNLIFKHFDETTYKDAIELLHQNGISVDLNVMATLPFLSQKEQIEESSKSILDALKPYNEGGYGADSVVVFPLNIRDNTFCKYAFDTQDEYNKSQGTKSPDWLQKEFPIWSMIATLENIKNVDESLLSRVSIAAWFGNRSISEENTETYPKDFYKVFDNLTEYRQNRKKRAEIVDELIKHPDYIKFKQMVQAQNDVEISYHDRAEYLHELIKNFGKNPPLACPCQKGEDE